MEYKPWMVASLAAADGVVEADDGGADDPGIDECGTDGPWVGLPDPFVGPGAPGSERLGRAGSDTLPPPLGCAGADVVEASVEVVGATAEDDGARVSEDVVDDGELLHADSTTDTATPATTRVAARLTDTVTASSFPSRALFTL